MKFMVIKSGDQNYRWDLGNGVALNVSTHVRPMDVDDPPDPAMAAAYVLQTDLRVEGIEGGRYTLTCTYGSMNGEKIEGTFDGVTTLNLQPGDYEIVIHSGSNDVLAGELADPVGHGCS